MRGCIAARGAMSELAFHVKGGDTFRLRQGAKAKDEAASSGRRYFQYVSGSMGAGAALSVPGRLAIISTALDQKRRGQAIGTWSGFTAITIAIGPVLGGWLVEHASWRWVFFINVPLAVAEIVISLWRIPEARSTAAHRVDWLEAFLATLGLGGLVYGCIESTSLGWKNPLIFGSLIGGLANLTCFVAPETHTGPPMIPFALSQSGF
jgi:MFS family permease